MISHLVKWNKELKSKGLVVIDIDNGKIDKQAKIQKHLEDSKIEYATLWDKDEANCKAYGVKGYPAQYLIGVDGKVIWEGFALEEGAMEKVEKAIKAELEKVKKEDAEKNK